MRSLSARVALASVLAAAAASGARAFEFFDGRLQVHGYFEAQLRAMARDFDPSDDWDLTQWYNILNVEIEADVAPDGFGPFDLVSAFVRLEARYDCVWTRACGLARSANAFGNRAAEQPKRLNDGRRAGFRSSGHVFNGDQRAFRNISREFLPFAFSRVDFTNVDSPQTPNERSVISKFFNIQGIDTLYDNVGIDGVFGTADDPAPFYFDRQERDCRFNFRDRAGPQNGVGNQILVWNPKCRIEPFGALAGKPDPLSAQDFSPITGMTGGPPDPPLPFRPQALNRATYAPSDPEVLSGQVAAGSPRPFVDRAESQGVYFPNMELARRLRNGGFDSFDQNFRQAELEWNRGASQQDEKELKEAYLDVELVDSRLWLRAGRQQIVWGKTELFRNQDLWNPQDLALASLPSLEESRISQWSIRGVWSFYEVGPFEDVRLELAMLWNKFEPTDIGRCGEPYTPNPACDKTLGLFIHGLTGFGVAGEVRPPDPWDDLSGTEVGARLEWRWNRFSFALTDYYGYQDLPYQDQIFVYSRNVDPVSGRPRTGMSTGDCDVNVFSSGPPASRYTPGSVTDPDCLTPDNVLAEHSVNQQLFRLICATSIGFLSLDRASCGQTVFSSRNNALTSAPAANAITEPTVGALLGNLLVGNSNAGSIGIALAGPTFPSTLVALNRDPCDGLLEDCATMAQGTFAGGTLPDIDTPNTVFNAGGVPTMNLRLTQQQKALLGCGQFYGTNCEIDGVDLMNSEALALLQSWVGIEGTGIDGIGSGDTFENVPQPGTIGFVPFRGPIGTRVVDSGVLILPGMRGANDPATAADDDPGYNPGLDGCSAPGPLGCNNGDMFMLPDGTMVTRTQPDAVALQHPFAGSGPDMMIGTPDDIPAEYQFFASEMAALSFNGLMTAVALSLPNADGIIDLSEFDATRPFRTDGCSFARVQYCSTVQSFFQISGLQRNTVNAGGNGRFGRRDFSWHGGRDFALRYEKRNVLGFSADFAEDRTKSNWGVEFTWQDDLTFADNDAFDGLATGVDTYNLTISVDRPTFINFLNANRTFFMNSQVFVQYVDGYRSSFTTDGPWNFLGVLVLETGYFDDRLIPRMTLVYDVRSNSGAWIPQFTYRFSSDFSVTVGMALFAGREQTRKMALTPTSLSNRVGRKAYEDPVENGLSAVRDRDEVFLRIRYSF